MDDMTVVNHADTRKTYRIGFNDCDETEFDVDDIAELIECSVGFFAENGIVNPKINYVEEVFTDNKK